MTPAFPKSAPVRLKGKALEKLRADCWARDFGLCQDCGKAPRYVLPNSHPDSYHMAHIKSRGANGADELSNVRVLCGACHTREHTKGKR